MTDAELSGPWNTARLDALAADVEKIKQTLEDAPRLRDMADTMTEIRRELAARRDEEKDDMRQEISELRQRPRQIMIAFAAPIFVGLILYLITHAI